jgi:hypothetical protein
MRRIDRITDPAFGLDSEDEGVQERIPLDRFPLGQRQDGGRDRAAGMDDGLEMGIVEVEGMRRGAVHERREHDVEPVAAAEHRGLARPRELGQRRERALHRLMARSADRAADPVEKRARRLVPHFFRDISVAVIDDEFGECSGDFHIISVNREWGMGNGSNLPRYAQQRFPVSYFLFPISYFLIEDTFAPTARSRRA